MKFKFFLLIKIFLYDIIVEIIIMEVIYMDKKVIIGIIITVVVVLLVVGMYFVFGNKEYKSHENAFYKMS